VKATAAGAPAVAWPDAVLPDAVLNVTQLHPVTAVVNDKTPPPGFVRSTCPSNGALPCARPIGEVGLTQNQLRAAERIARSA